MSESLQPEDVRVGLIVRHTTMPEWGLGKIVRVEDDWLHVYFRDCPGNLKEAVRKISREVALLTVADRQADGWLDHLPPAVMDGHIVATDSARLTERQAVDVFVGRYGDFASNTYVGRERECRLSAHEFLTENMLSRKGRKRVAQGPAAAVAAILERACETADLLTPQELTALREAFKADAEAARRYAIAILDFVDAPAEATFLALVDATSSLPAEPGHARVLSWPTVTLLPYLASPDHLMFLKPSVTKRVASALSFDLAYSSEPSWTTYSRLLVLSDLLYARLTRMGARDYIDVQSFMWIVAGEPGAATLACN